MSAAGGGGLLGGIFRRFLGSAVSNAAGYAVGGAIQPTLEPLTQALANETWQLYPVRPLPAATAAQAALRGLMDDGTAEAEAAMSGFDAGAFETLRRVSGQPPPLATLLDLRRRDVIGDAELEAGIRQLGYLLEWRDVVKALRNVLPSVTDMVRFAVREVYDPAARAALDLDAEFPAAFAADAKRIGLNAETAGNYWAAHWELPSYEQGVAMLFRGEITQPQFDGLLKALDYAPVWRPRLREIARAIPPISDMIRFAVREVYDPASVQALGLDADYPAAFTPEAALHGMDEDRARQYWQAHWRLPSARQGYTMLWRGEITETQLDGLLKALDYPPVWRDRLASIARIVPGRIDLKRMFRLDIIDREQVEAGYRRLGYSAADAELMTQIAEAEAGTAAPGETYVTRARSGLFNRLRSEYVARQLTQAEALDGLATVGVPAAQRGPVVSLWAAERDYVRTELTQAQIVKAYKKNEYTEAEALAELVERGMTEADAGVRLRSG